MVLTKTQINQSHNHLLNNNYIPNSIYLYRDVHTCLHVHVDVSNYLLFPIIYWDFVCSASATSWSHCHCVVSDTGRQWLLIIPPMLLCPYSITALSHPWILLIRHKAIVFYAITAQYGKFCKTATCIWSQFFWHFSCSLKTELYTNLLKHVMPTF